MAQHTGHFGISSKLQEVLCLLGQSCVFEEGEEILDELLGLQISGRQIQRVSEYYGEEAEKNEQKIVKEENPVVQLSMKQKTTPVYMLNDASLLYTREEEWKEIKVGRIFAQEDITAIQKNRNQITQSLYVSHLGNHKDFLEKWDAYTRPYANKIFIGDGAKWNWNWVDDYYPESVQILDFYHAVEKLSFYAFHQYTHEKERKRWMKKQKKELLQNNVQKIIGLLKNSQGRTEEAEKARQEVLRYYENNSHRMQYKTYLDKGYLIGSGAIESAHREIVQQRLKLSGQRWSIKGAQQIVNLRVYRKSNRWNDVVQFIKNAA